MERVDDTQMGIDDFPFKNDVAALSMSGLTAVPDARALFLSEVSRESLLSKTASADALAPSYWTSYTVRQSCETNTRSSQGAWLQLACGNHVDSRNQRTVSGFLKRLDLVKVQVPINLCAERLKFIRVAKIFFHRRKLPQDARDRGEFR